MRHARISSICFLTALIWAGLSLTALASESEGAITTGSHLTRICQDETCSTYGTVNWKPTLSDQTTGATAVTITDSGLSGWLWGDEIGWVNLQPTGSGVQMNPVSGELSGYAYANVGSWINFSPTTVSGNTEVGVTINGDGQFEGWAYVSGLSGGWMKFDCSSAETCIETDWRPTGERTAVISASSGSNGSSVRMDYQFATPATTSWAGLMNMLPNSMNTSTVFSEIPANDMVSERTAVPSDSQYPFKNSSEDATSVKSQSFWRTILILAIALSLALVVAVMGRRFLDRRR